MNGKLGRKAAIETSPDRPATLPVRPDGIAELLRRLPRWLVWRWERSGDRWSKVPYQALDPATHAKSTDPATWGTFEQALTSHREGRADGVGFVLSRPTASRPDLPDDNLACVDLDDIRTEAGTLTEEADEIVSRRASYAEVSPTSTGVKVSLRGDKPAGRCKFPEAEVYTSARYLALTGWHLDDTPSEVVEAGEALRALHGEWEARLARARPPAPTIAPAPARAQRRGGPSVEERAVAYLNRCPPAVSGCDGHGTTLSVARAVVWGFDLGAERGYDLLEMHYNGRCQPPWSERDLRHKCEEADRVTFGKARGWLLNEEREPPARRHTSNAVAAPHRNGTGEPGPEPEEESPRAFVWAPMDSATFFATDYRPTWLVKRQLVRGQPAVMGGPYKSLKTSFALDLAVSLAAGVPFLGKFDVYQPVRVAVLSGESGPHTIQETGRRVALARGIEPAGLQVVWQFRLPSLADPVQMGDLARGLARDRIDVVIIDPLYLCLLPGHPDLQASNLYHIGPLLLRVAGACLDVGVTPVLLHHANRPASRTREPLELGDLAFSGIAEFARQWLLINRREPFKPGDPHKLWVGAGGSCGQGGLWSVDVHEGTLGEDFEGREWDVRVETAGNEIERQKSQAGEKKTQAKQKVNGDQEQAFLRALDEHASRDHGGWARMRQVRATAGQSGETIDAVAARLKGKGLVDLVEDLRVLKGFEGGQKTAGVRRKPESDS